jgi:hypothetical protein
VTANVVRVYTNCDFEGDSDGPESVDFGMGSGSVTTSATCPMWGTLSWVRTYNMWQWTGTLTIEGTSCTVAASASTSAPTSANPDTSAGMDGDWIC